MGSKIFSVYDDILSNGEKFAIESKQDTMIAALATVAANNARYAIRIDDAGSGIKYVGKAAIGSATGSALWQVQKLDESTPGDLIVTWADSNAAFDNVWNNRAILTYG